MNDVLYTYSLIEVLYNRGKDYIDCFWPFVLAVLPKDKSEVEIARVQELIRLKGLDIPQHSLTIIATRAKHKGLVIQTKGALALTDKGIKSAASLESDREAERRINELVEDARIWLEREQNLSLSTQATKDLISTFIAEHLDLLEGFLSPGHEQGVPSSVLTKQDEAALLRYFAAVEETKPIIFETLQDVICGSLLSVIVNSEHLPESTRSFGHVRVYLDTNILLSLLGLHYEEYNIPALELYTLMKGEGTFKLSAFDFTIDEIAGVLSGYPGLANRYIPGFKVGSIYSSLRAQKKTSADIKSLIANLPSRLSDLGIDIQPTKINIDDDSAIDEKDRNSLTCYKHSQRKRGQNHDLSVIKIVAEQRGGQVRRIEEAKTLFLTSDRGLANYAYIELGHRSKASVSEVVLDKVLANVLWLKKPTIVKAIPLHLIIAMHSRELFIDKTVWEQFYETIQRLRITNAISERDITLLLYDQRLHDKLLEYGPDNVQQINDTWLLSSLDDAKRKVEDEKQADLAMQSIVFESKLKDEQMQATEEFIQTLSDREEEFNQRSKRAQQKQTEKFINTIQSQKTVIKQNAIIASERLSKVYKYTIVLGMFFTGWFLSPWIVANWSVVEPRAWITSIIGTMVFGFLGIKLRKLSIFSTIDNWIFSRTYNRLLYNSRLNELEKSLDHKGETNQFT